MKPFKDIEKTEFLVMEEFADPFRLQVFFDDMKYRIVVTDTKNNKELVETLTASHEPRFGMDIFDSQIVLEKAEEMCVWLEKNETT